MLGTALALMRQKPMIFPISISLQIHEKFELL